MMTMPITIIRAIMPKTIQVVGLTSISALYIKRALFHSQYAAVTTSMISAKGVNTSMIAVSPVVSQFTTISTPLITFAKPCNIVPASLKPKAACRNACTDVTTGSIIPHSIENHSEITGSFSVKKASNGFKNPSRDKLGISALVLDDNITNNMIIKDTLAHLGIDCKAFTLSEMAFEELASNEPDILFVDYNMPDINGIDFVEELKLNNLLRGSKLICITGDTTKSTRSKLDEHFDQVLYKPVRQNSLREIIDALKVSLNTRRHIIELGKYGSD
ncbi:MAG: response regulator [Pedobacter sp.]|nr:MAG: response regulator [Pedobacter sp.]